MADISSPHDSFFRSILADTQLAVQYFKSALPEHVSQKLDFSTLERSPDSYVSGELEKSMSDAVYACRRLDGKGSVEVSLLVEHKSYRDEHTPVQVGGYLFSGYQQQIKQGKKQLVPIIPILFYHGRRKWEYWPLERLFGELDASLLVFLPKFSYVYNDIRDTPDEVIETIGSRFLASSLLLLKHSHDKQWLAENFIKLLLLGLHEVSEELQRAHLTYSFIQVEFTEEQIRDIIKELPLTLKNTVMSTYEILVEKGRKEGLAKVEKLIDQERANAYAEKLKSASEFKKMGVPVADIAKGLHLSIEEIEKL